MSKNSSAQIQLHKLTLQRGKLGRLKYVMYKAEYVKERYYKKYQALILGMIDFVHLLNDHTSLVNFKS